MKKAILATKVGMTQIFNADGVLVPVTVLEAGPCSVTQIKTVENDGYSAVQVAFADKKERIVNKDANGKKEIRNRHGVNKAQMGHFAKAGVSGKRFVKAGFPEGCLYRFRFAGTCCDAAAMIERCLSECLAESSACAGDKPNGSFHFSSFLRASACEEQEAGQSLVFMLCGLT